MENNNDLIMEKIKQLEEDRKELKKKIEMLEVKTAEVGS